MPRSPRWPLRTTRAAASEAWLSRGWAERQGPGQLMVAHLEGSLSWKEGIQPSRGGCTGRSKILDHRPNTFVFCPPAHSNRSLARQYTNPVLERLTAAAEHACFEDCSESATLSRTMMWERRPTSQSCSGRCCTD